MGIAQNNYKRDFLHQFPDLENDVKKLLTSGIPHLDTAERFSLPLILAHAIDLQGRTDQQRCKRLGITLQPYDVWNFTRCDDLYGHDWPGRIPGQLVAHVLYFFTKPGELVLDPMAGSGTTPDVCLALGRKCYAFDLSQAHGRPDILMHDLATGWPEQLKKANLIFWDPPYFAKKDDAYVEGSISGLEIRAYLQLFKERFAEAYATVKIGTRLAFLMSDYNDEEHRRVLLRLADYDLLMEGAGWTIHRVIQCPLSTQTVHPDTVERFREDKQLACLSRSLIVAEKR